MKNNPPFREMAMLRSPLHQWTVKDYHRMIAAGILSTDDAVELLEGKIVQMNPQNAPHASTVQKRILNGETLFSLMAFPDISLAISDLFPPLLE